MTSLFNCRTFISGLFLLLAFFTHEVKATHLMGGSMTYEYQGLVGTNQSYKVTLKIYRYCDASAGGTAPLDPSMFLGIYNQDPLNPNDDKNWFATENLILISSGFITPPSIGSNCAFSSSVCVEEGVFEADILLPPDPGGYHLMVERCCRNGNIVNLSTPGSIGQTYYCFIPPSPIINSSPQFNDIPVPFICAGDTATIVNNAFDPDGDSLVYSFELPYSGYSSSITAVPDPQIDNNPYAFPIPPVLYNPGYSINSPFGAGGVNTIDPITGLTKYYIPNQGFFVVAIEIKEYRNGVLIAFIRRDLQLIAIPCPVNAVPSLSFNNGSGQSNYTITEGQTICFPVIFFDNNGDSLYLTSSGAIFNSAITNPPASLPNANGDGILFSQFCWSTDCGQARNAPYQFTVSVIDNGCPPKITNQVYSIKVNPSPGPPAPAVAIQQNPPGPICTGTAVTFTALPTFGGTNPIYQWKLNGINVGANSNTYSSSSLSNGDVITVSLISNSVCVNTFNAVSPPVVMIVNPFAAPSVSISQNPPGTFCAGTNISFTALPVNPGATPIYQWTVNGLNVGINSPVFSSTTLTIGNQVGVSLLADPGCPAAASNIINVAVNPVLTPSVTITSDNLGAICPGELVTFRAFPTNGGSLPIFQWQVNGVNVGVNSNLFSSATLNNGDIVKVILTSNENCLTVAVANSNNIVITVTAPTSASISISANPSTPICEQDNIIFSAVATNGGTNPIYQWQVNGAFTGATGPTYAIASLSDGDQVSAVLTSSLTCLTTGTANSNVITVAVNPILPVSSIISISPSNQFCTGTLVTFTGTVVNGGTNPSYQWQVNGANAGGNSNTFSASTLNDGDRIRVIVTSNLNCVSPVTAASNIIIVSVLPLTNPSVSITANPAGTVCQGTPIVFTAAPLVGGSNPTYQWTVNGNPSGSGFVTFTTSALNDGDIVKVAMTSSAVCPFPATVNSNPIVMNVISTVIPDVTISANVVWPICDGTPVTFNASVVNGGPVPAFNWQINGVNTGTNSPALTIANLVDGDSIKVRLVSNATCANPVVVFSNVIVADVLPILSPAVSINLSPSTPVCDGDLITVFSNSVHGGSNPSFQWFVNNQPFGSGQDSLTAVFNDGDVISLVFTSSYQCLTNPTDTSNILTTVVLPNLTPLIAITVNPQGPVCPGDLLNFSASTTHAGTAPVYQWLLNGAAIGGNNPFLNSFGFADGDIIEVILTSSETCVTSPNATSNSIPVQISPNITPDVNIAVAPLGPICVGDLLSFTATFTGGGLTPSFNWRVNGVTSGLTGNTFSSTTLQNGDNVDVVMTSSAFCALPVRDTSNQIPAIVNPLLTPTVFLSANPSGQFCDGAEITYSASTTNGGLFPSFQWLLNGNGVGVNSDTLVSSLFLNSDTLQIQLTSSETCLALNPVSSNLIIIDRLPPLDPFIIAPDEICEGKEVTLEVQANGGNGGPYYFNWDNGLGQGTSYTFILNQTTTYTVTVSDSCSTPRNASKTITVNLLPEPAFVIEPPQATILNPYFDFIDASVNTTTWQWDFGDGQSTTLQNPSHTYLEPGTYAIQLIATSEKGCVDSTSSELIVENVVTWYIPNSFTPNNDGTNDEFGPVGYSIEGYELSVFGRWGQAVFVSSGSFDKWNGNDESGKPYPEGLYVYKLKIVNDPARKVRTGTVTIIR